MSLTFNYTDTFDFSEVQDGLQIRGIAFKSGKIEGKGVFIDPEELPRIAKSLKNVPLIDSHNKETVLSTLGKVISGVADEKYVRYIAQVYDPDAVQLIKNGLIKGVSVGLRYDEIKPYSEDYIQLSGIDVVELSLTNFPAIPEASIGFSIELPTMTLNPAETFNKLQKEKIQTDLMKEFIQTIESQKTEINNLKNKLYFSEYANRFEWDDKFYKYTLEDLQNLIEAAHELACYKFVPKGSVPYEEIDFDPKKTLKEDFREMIFRKRNDGKELKGLHGEKDLNKSDR